MSLRLRFALIATVLLAATLLAAGAWITRAEKRLFESDVASRMQELAHEHLPSPVGLPTLPFGPGGGPGGLPPAQALDIERVERGSDGADFQILYFGRSGRWLHHVRHTTAQPLSAGGAWSPEEESLGDPTLRVELLAGREFLTSTVFISTADAPAMRNMPVHPGPGTQLVRVMIERAPLQAGLQERRTALGMAGLAALALGAVLAFLLSGMMVRPIRTAAAAAEEISRADQRLPAPGSRDELGRLVVVLNQMLERLESATARERRFLATASHELRRPLAALTGELELAGRGTRSREELASAIALSLSDAQRMGRLVDDLLTHARAQAGTLSRSDTEMELSDLVTSVATKAGRILPPGAQLEVAEVPELRIRGNRDALGRAVENLISNAALHGGDGVIIRVRAGPDEGGAAIHVEDDGPGVPPEELDQVFKPFGRGDTARLASGAGLGLAIVRDLVQAHQGRVAVCSPAAGGRGARFSIYLPPERLVD